tara:strand:- start:310 stop:672 length:363 start_codon:yes stop_codon:yes gene_type:complete
MPQITLSKNQVTKLSKFMRKHDSENWFLAKDQGAYVGATGGSHEDGNFENCLYYFKGCDPNKDEFFYDTAREKFGGDDFGEQFDAEIIHDLADDPRFISVVVKVTADAVDLIVSKRGESK